MVLLNLFILQTSCSYVNCTKPLLMEEYIYRVIYSVSFPFNTSAVCQAIDLTEVAAKDLSIVPSVGFFCVCWFLANCEGMKRHRSYEVIAVYAKNHSSLPSHSTSMFLLPVPSFLPSSHYTIVTRLLPISW